LTHLAASDFTGAPRPLKADAEGNQVLTFLAGDTVGDHVPWPDWVFSETLLAEVGMWMRRLHDHTASFVPPAQAVWFSGHSWRPGLIVGHQDAAPWNVVTRDGRLVGFVDWDTAGPSTPERDLALAAITWVPLFAPSFAADLGFTDFAGRARRLHLLLDAYDYDGDRGQFGLHIAERAALQAGIIRQLADTGDPVYVAMRHLADEFDRVETQIAALPAHWWSR
jgi:hypothetical protein